MDIINYSKIKKVEADLAQHKLDYAEHLDNTMPHEMIDFQNDKIYKYGFQISEDGNPQIIFEEVE